MKNIKRMISGWVTGALFLGLLSACEKEKTLMYEQEAGVYFYGQAASEYSFVTNLGGDVYVQNIRVATTGDSVSYDRKVMIAVVEGDTNYVNTARPEQYQLLEGIVPAGKFEGSVAVELHRTKDMSDSTFIVHVKLVPNEDFPLAGFDRRYFALSVTDQLTEPSNWNYLSYYFGNFSVSWYRFILGVLDLPLIPFDIEVPEGIEEWTYTELDAAVAQVRTALYKYNREHPGEPLRHEDGRYEGDEVVMP